MSARSDGGPSTSAWSRNAATKERNAGQWLTATSKTTEPSGRSSTAVSRPSWFGPHGVLAVDEQAGQYGLVVAELPGFGRAGAGLVGPLEAAGLAQHDRALDAVEPEVRARRRSAGRVR